MRRAVCLTAYDRVEYTDQTLAHLVHNDLSDYDLWAFQDSSTDLNAHKTVERMLRKSGFRIVQQPVHIGLGLNVIESRFRLFDIERYDYVFFLEDDCVMAPYTVEAASCWWLALDRLREDPWITSMCVDCYDTAETKQQHLSDTTSAFRFVCYTMDRRAWRAIRNYVAAYQRSFLAPLLFADSPYKSRDNAAILRWFDEIAPGFDLSGATGQDAATLAACQAVDVARISPAVNHARHIGERGEHCTPASFRSEGFDRIRLDLFDPDLVLTACRKPQFAGK